ncbi:basic helix-loop-helix domain-containing protein [Aspergillus clavatus NRRL 1]|uniref:HLH transcription factor, putative n=1 Tax=Aspergillus clavatus (strain ATCC 1007 / CBS 513.65 / DSM 816 / NCTC 3887 / NRRL 1 / QM 1276 / 107) TaxID=344612 RepID=A1C6R2_ASPCL|nr:HLH transcription factor, putative [Aspergillus clavatus NRRL 1]EAW14083.1 HLH transcription factor, putative [Aspergillus clavatus NRRL 1]
MNMKDPETRPRQKGDGHGPFGYSFLSPMDTPYEPAPAPPPGPALLDDNESNMLDNFFTTMNSNHFTDDFWLRNQTNKFLDPINFEWSTELPPTFEGSTTSLGQPSHAQDMDKHGTGLMPNHTNTNSDILAAASMLYQNGMVGSDINPTYGHHFPSIPDMNFNRPVTNGHGKNPQPSNHVAIEQPSATPARLPVGFHTSEMLFDVREPMSAEQQASAKVGPLHWGSDISFMDQGYIAPPDQPNEEERTKELLVKLECLEPQSSAANTRAPSPERTASSYNPQWTESGPAGPLHNLPRDFNRGLEEFSQPKKRQRVSIKQEDDENSDADSARPRSRRSKSSAGGKPRRTSNETSRKPKLQQSNKAARENLTEEQKRNNHILSEQKRRNLIRQGFDDLCSLVPGLNGGGFSKSAMLTQAADWLEEILRGNDILKAQLAELKTMNGLVMPR